MKGLIIAVALLASFAAHSQAYKSHGPDGKPYWVIQCMAGVGGAEECFEGAYQWCEKGPYIQIDKQGAYLVTPLWFQFRFVCKKPHKEAQK